MGSETSPVGSAGTGGRCVHGEVAQKGIQRMNVVELALSGTYLKLSHSVQHQAALTYRR